MKKTIILNLNHTRTGFNKDDITLVEHKETELKTDDAGNIVQEIHYHPDGEILCTIDHQYNEKKQPILSEQFDGQNELCERNIKQYNEQHQLIREDIYYGENMPAYSTLYQYENNLLVKQDIYDDNEYDYKEKEYHYKNGLLIKEIEYNEEGKEAYIIESNYNQSSILSKKIRHEIQQKDRRSYEFEYDDRQNKIKELVYNYNDELISKSYYTYNEDNQIMETEEEDLDHYQLTKFEYEGKNLIKSMVYGKGNLLLSWSEYLYNEQKEIIKIVNYKQDEVVPSEYRILNEIRYERIS
ncbi:MAG: hypothetical protein RR356_01775 [Bacteroidales bacterium]